MTTEALEETLYGLNPAEPGDPLVKAVNRLAQAIEQATLAKLDTASSVPPALASLPPVRTQPILAPATVCPIHKEAWKIVPAGVSKKTGQSYDSFAACPVRGCDQRPPR